MLNINDEFFNDICYSYNNDNNTDIILEDRVKDIYQNYSICDNNCQYDAINLETKLVECSCEVKSNVRSEEEEANFVEMISISFKSTNFAVLKCYKLVFNSKVLSKNIGFWLMMPLTIIHIPLIIYYLIYGINSTKLFIFNEMKNKNFLINLDNTVKKKGKVNHQTPLG